MLIYHDDWGSQREKEGKTSNIIFVALAGKIILLEKTKRLIQKYFPFMYYTLGCTEIWSN